MMAAETAAEIVAAFKGLMPKLTEQQTDALFDAIRPLGDPQTVRQKLLDYANNHEDFSLAGVRSMLGLKEYAPPDGRHARTALALASERKTARQVQADWARVDALLDRLAPAELAELKTAALARMAPPMAARYGPADPSDKNRRYLRAMMADELSTAVKR